MDGWEKFNKTLPEKEDFYSYLNMEDITDVDYTHAKRVCKDFEIKDLGECHDLYVQSNTLLADAFVSFRSICIKIYKLDPAKFLSAPGLAWQTALKKTEEKLDLLSYINILLMVGRGIKGGMCHSIYWYAKGKKDNDENNESSYIQYWNVNNLHGWAKFPVNNFEWIKHTSQFNKDFIKNCNEESYEGYNLEVDVQYLEKLYQLHNDLTFLPERLKIKKVEMTVTNLLDKTNMLYTYHTELLNLIKILGENHIFISTQI